MDKNEMDAVLDALKRINRSLDERFEKDADLYIAPEQVEKIKKLIYNGNYDKIVKDCSPQLKKFSPRAMANVLIKNAWLMRSSDYEKLRPVFKSCEFSDLQNLLNEGVLDNKIDMPAEFRFWLILFYLNGSTAKDCLEMFKQNLIFLNHPTLKAVCVKQLLKDLTIEDRYQKFNACVYRAKNLLTQEKIFAETFPRGEITDTIKNLIFIEHLKKESPASLFWANRLKADDIPFIMGKYKEHCRQNSSDVGKCSELLGRLFLIGRKNFQEFADRFADACSCMDGNNKKNKLAEKCLRRANPKEKKILQDALQKHGINDVEVSELADVDKIIEILSSNRYQRALGFLVTSFDKQYSSDYKNKLKEISEEIDEEVFHEFCCSLFEMREWRLNYLLYVIDNLVPQEASNSHPLVKRVLKHIENQNLFLAGRLDKNLLRRVKEFVKEKDFTLFAKLTRF